MNGAGNVSFIGFSDSYTFSQPDKLLMKTSRRLSNSESLANNVRSYQALIGSQSQFFGGSGYLPSIDIPPLNKKRRWSLFNFP